MGATTAPTPRLRDLLSRLIRAVEERPLAERSTPFTVAEIAARWGCSEKHVERLCQSGELKAFKPARAWLVRPVALAKFERDQSGEERP